MCKMLLLVLIAALISPAICYNIGIFSRNFPVWDAKTPMTMSGNIPSSLMDKVHGVKMGISSDMCDNAKNNLSIDWDGSPLNYTCYHPKNRLPVIKVIDPVEECNIPEDYFPKHVCMNEKITYDVQIPTYGNHRPLWPVYGEYVFVPPQRWLHNLEHGAVVMLYHPCAEPYEVEQLKKIVKGCLRRHIITPSKLVPADKPLVLVAWGCKLEMNYVDEGVVKSFIKTRAFHAPEGELAKEGQYTLKLLKKASVPKGSNFMDKNLCPS